MPAALETNTNKSREKLTKIRKLDMEIQRVKPQIRDHSNKVAASKDFNRSTGLSMLQTFRNYVPYKLTT